jgi:hypothetical protein
MKNTVMVILIVLVGLLGAALAKTSSKLKAVTSNTQAEQIRGYLDIVERYSTIAKDPSQSGVAAVLYTKEIFKTTPAETAINYFDDVLPQVTDPAVQRAIRLELVELYLHGTKPNRQKAMDQLRMLMGAKRPATQPIAMETSEGR